MVVRAERRTYGRAMGDAEPLRGLSGDRGELTEAELVADVHDWFAAAWEN